MELLNRARTVTVKYTWFLRFIAQGVLASVDCWLNKVKSMFVFEKLDNPGRTTQVSSK